MDDLTPEQRRKNMQHIRSKDTSIEIKLRKALWHEGIRYRKNYKALRGTQILLSQSIELPYSVILHFGMVVILIRRNLLRRTTSIGILKLEGIWNEI